jgi:hypothetical protein
MTLTTTIGERFWSMQCDFNSIDDDGTVLASFEGHPDLRPMVRSGDRVMLRDGEGNSCEGILAYVNPGWNDNYATCQVRWDSKTWKSEGTGEVIQ